MRVDTGAGERGSAALWTIIHPASVSVRWAVQREHTRPSGSGHPLVRSLPLLPPRVALSSLQLSLGAAAAAAAAAAAVFAGGTVCVHSGRKSFPVRGLFMTSVLKRPQTGTANRRREQGRFCREEDSELSC